MISSAISTRLSTLYIFLPHRHRGRLADTLFINDLDPADESRAPELWDNQAAWLKVDKVMWIHQDLVREMQGHLRDCEPP